MKRARYFLFASDNPKTGSHFWVRCLLVRASDHPKTGSHFWVRCLIDFIVIVPGIEFQLAALGHFEREVGNHPARLDDFALRSRHAVGELALDHPAGAG